jgi:hypothetical protein
MNGRKCTPNSARSPGQESDLTRRGRVPAQDRSRSQVDSFPLTSLLSYRSVPVERFLPDWPVGDGLVIQLLTYEYIKR